MTVTTCDICGDEITLESRKNITGDFVLTNTKTTTSYPFRIEDIKIIWAFNSTNVHVCNSCLKEGIKNANLNL